jgi:hypothetical protein
METPPTVIIELCEWSPPLFRVLYVDERIISNSNLKAGEILTDTDLDYIMDIFGEFGVQVNYPKEPKSR